MKYEQIIDLVSFEGWVKLIKFAKRALKGSKIFEVSLLGIYLLHDGERIAEIRPKNKKAVIIVKILYSKEMGKEEIRSTIHKAEKIYNLLKIRYRNYHM